MNDVSDLIFNFPKLGFLLTLRLLQDLQKYGKFYIVPIHSAFSYYYSTTMYLIMDGCVPAAMFIKEVGLFELLFCQARNASNLTIQAKSK